MRAVLHGAALLVGVCCLTWLAVLWRWQATARQVTPADFGLYLVLLPVLVFGFALALRWAWRGAAERQAAAAAAPATAPAARQAAAAGVDEAERHLTLQLLAAAVNSAAGTAPAALLEAGRARQPLPRVDATLRNAEGLPVMSARVADLDTSATAEALAVLQRQAAPEGDDALPPPEHLLRALALLAAPLSQALQALLPWHEQLASPQAPSRLQVIAAWPAWWREADRTLATAWLRQALSAEPALALAADRFSLDARALNAVELWIEADRCLQRLRREKRPDLLLLAAAHSDLSDEAIATLEMQRRLFTAGSHPKGLIPSEAAAALVLAPAGWPAPPDAPPPVHLHRAAVAQRDKSIEAPGSVSSQVLGEALAAALAAARLPADQVAAVVADADQHTPRGTELFGLTLKALPQIDPAEQLCLTGGVAGHGEAGALMAVAAAAAQVQAEPKPCVALALGDSHWRMAVVVRPAPPDAPAAAAGAAP